MNANVVSVESQSSGKGLNIALWVVQVLLALGFGMIGGMKLVSSPEALAAMGIHHSLPLVRFIGLSELAGGLGMLLPALTRIKPLLTGWAGVGLAVVMVLAVGSHLMAGEISHIAFPLVLLALAAFVAWGRLVKAPFTPR